MAIAFDGPAKLIVLSATATLDVADLYSRWKDWARAADNAKFLAAFEAAGGETISAADNTRVPLYAFLANGWRLRPQEQSHTLNVSNGVLLVGGGGDPFVNTLGSFVVRINYQQPVQAITVATGGGAGGLTAPEVSADLLDAQPIEGARTLRDLLRILAAFAAGETVITSGAPGAATVVFKSLDGSKDRISATMDGSERTSVAVDPS